ncbi:MAG TPA: cytochrome c oxidase subunit II [Vicinamibacterales bacterium]|jgi:cytochrome c oxidase subunit 2|nr:cytochrome c oxidase subunit II [Vicinamibacterales bacterium]
MQSSFPLFPEAASSIASDVDLLYFFILAVSSFFAILVSAAVVYFAIKYRRRHADEVGHDIHGSIALELIWTVIPFVLAMVMFFWGADLYFRLARPPADSMEVFVVGKQWMWKVQHPEGVREINELHVPINRNVRITLGSEDVLHDYYIPAFRVKMDAVPGKLTTMWFKATKAGTYRIFCAEYCGTQHSGMIGHVIAMEEHDYEAWLAGGRTTGTAVENGERLFTQLACITCHKTDTSGRGPVLAGVFGSTVQLMDGRKVVVDENYLRESIMNPQAKIVLGYQPIMPTFQGTVSEENLLQLIAYIKQLKAPAAAPAAGAPAAAGQPGGK